LDPGEQTEYKVKTRISADLASMTSLKCQQDILKTRLVLLSESVPTAPPCGISILDQDGHEIPVKKAERSTILQAQAQIMYSPFSIHRERESTTQAEKKLIEAPAV